MTIVDSLTGKGKPTRMEEYMEDLREQQPDLSEDQFLGNIASLSESEWQKLSETNSGMLAQIFSRIFGR